MTTVESRSAGVPFGVVVLLAAVMSLPTILQMSDSTMAFEDGVTRLLVALGVAWLLTNLVYAVVDSMSEDEVAVMVAAEPPLSGAPGYLPAPEEPPYPQTTS
ncbi:MAG TPA: hypothetical protein VES02_02445 [Dermatophilaceae bacterium]|nr:hypothetical protein [Dermatophilaceae bacterium]